VVVLNLFVAIQACLEEALGPGLVLTSEDLGREETCLGSSDGVRRHARDWITARLQRGVTPSEILVIGHSRPGMNNMAEWLSTEGIAASFLPDRRMDGTVSVSTIHSSKGLDAAHVLILNAHELDGLEEAEEARRLLYIAMTRARDELCVSFARPLWVMGEIARAVDAESTP